MKNIAAVLGLTAALSLVGIAISPPQAQAIPSLNPLCWIADKNAPGVKENCKGHNWSWPHFGGGSSNDGPDRGCGSTHIMADKIPLSQGDLNQLGAAMGFVQPHLILTNYKKTDVRWGRDYYTNTWQPEDYYSLVYSNGTTKTYWVNTGPATTVQCKMNGQYR